MIYDDFQIPDSLQTKILNIEKISTIVYTNTLKCAPGVVYQICIMINIPISGLEEVSFKEKQKAAREIGDSVIDDINQTLGTNTKFHSIVAQTEPSLISQEEVTITAVYTDAKITNQVDV